MVVSLNQVDHIHVYVADRTAAERWYAEVLRLNRVPEFERWANGDGPLFIANSSRTVQLALFERPAMPCRSTIAFAVSASEFEAWRAHLAKAFDHELRIEDHGLSWSIYFADPDGNPYEITTYNLPSIT